MMTEENYSLLKYLCMALPYGVKLPEIVYNIKIALEKEREKLRREFENL